MNVIIIQLGMVLSLTWVPFLNWGKVAIKPRLTILGSFQMYLFHDEGFIRRKFWSRIHLKEKLFDNDLLQ